MRDDGLARADLLGVLVGLALGVVRLLARTLHELLLSLDQFRDALSLALLDQVQLLLRVLLEQAQLPVAEGVEVEIEQALALRVVDRLLAHQLPDATLVLLRKQVDIDGDLALLLVRQLPVDTGELRLPVVLLVEPVLEEI